MDSIRVSKCLTVCLLITIFCYINSYGGAGNDIDNEGIFILQLSWSNTSFDPKTFYELDYERDRTLKLNTKEEFLPVAGKNDMLQVKLKPGTYAINSINLRGKNIPVGKVLKIPVNRTVTIKAGEVTNGGQIFIGRESKESFEIYSLFLNNDNDCKRYLQAYIPAFKDSKINNAWPFADQEKLSKFIKSYGDYLVSAENGNKKTKYIYGIMGILIQVDRDETGNVINHKYLKLPTIQEIEKVSILGENLFCALGSGNFFYGKPDALKNVELPSGLESKPQIHLLGDRKFLLVDDFNNIFTATDNFNWNTQHEFRVNPKGQDLTFKPIVYLGEENMYIYASNNSVNKLFISSPYDRMNFESVEVNKDVKRITMVTETRNKLFVGPDFRQSPKKPAYLYVRDNHTGEWDIIDLPHGNCNRFSPAKDDDNTLFVECGNNKKYISKDGGKTWKTN